MGFIYQIKIGEDFYIGSTKKKLYYRQSQHNHILNNPNNRSYNYPLYKFCREKKVEKIICELIEEVVDNELILLEQEYMNMLEPTLNTRGAYRTEEEKIEYYKKKSKWKSNCPICGKLIIKKYIKQHINRIH